MGDIHPLGNVPKLNPEPITGAPRMETDMAGKSNSTAPPKPKTAVIQFDEPKPDTMRSFGGSKSDRFNTALIDSMTITGWFPPGQSDEDRDRQLFVAVTGLRAFAPTDEIEGMIAAQGMAAHHAAMECSRRAMVPDQPFEAAQGFRKAAANASRTFAELLAAFVPVAPMRNSRCRMHGGSSTGPTAAGIERIRLARTIHGRCSAEMIELRRMVAVLRREARRAITAVR